MTRDRQREIAIKRAMLTELANTPRGYLQPQQALVGALTLTVCPAATDAELDTAFRVLEADAMIHCEVDALGVKRWCITSIGRAALAE